MMNYDKQFNENTIFCNFFWSEQNVVGNNDECNFDMLLPIISSRGKHNEINCGVDTMTYVGLWDPQMLINDGNDLLRPNLPGCPLKFLGLVRSNIHRIGETLCFLMCFQSAPNKNIQKLRLVRQNVWLIRWFMLCQWLDPLQRPWEPPCEIRVRNDENPTCLTG